MTEDRADRFATFETLAAATRGLAAAADAYHRGFQALAASGALDPLPQGNPRVTWLRWWRFGYWIACGCGAPMKVRGALLPRCRGCRWRDRQRAKHRARFTDTTHSDTVNSRRASYVIVPAFATGTFMDVTSTPGESALQVRQNERDMVSRVFGIPERLLRED